MPFKRATPEDKEAKARLKAVQDAARAREQMRAAFMASPAGKARQAFERGDQVFQYSIDVHKTTAVVVAMVGAYARPVSTTDPSDILNSVCHEGWEVVNGSFVFLELGSESRDKFLASGQQVAVKGSVQGYYLFRRCEANRREVSQPWDEADPDELLICKHCGEKATVEDKFCPRCGAQRDPAFALGSASG